ncbi:MAG: hypothetical protein ACTHLT_03710 [Devosia sp.]
MTLDLSALAPSEPARLAIDLKAGKRAEEFAIALGRFLDQTTADGGAESDLLYSTAAELSSAGVFDALDPASVASIFLRISDSARKEFFRGLSDLARSGMAKAMRDAIVSQYSSNASGEPSSSLRHRLLVKKLAALKRRDDSDFWASMRVGRNNLRTIKTLSNHNVHYKPFLVRYDALTKNMKRGAITCVYFKPTDHDVKFSIIDEHKLNEISVFTPLYDLLDEKSSADLALDIPSSDDLTASEAVLRLVASLHAADKLGKESA